MAKATGGNTKNKDKNKGGDKNTIRGGTTGTVEYPTTGPPSPAPPPGSVDFNAPSGSTAPAGSPAPPGSTNVVRHPDGSWTWNNPDGTRTVQLPPDEDGEPRDPIILQPGQSLTGAHFGDYVPKTPEEQAEDRKEKDEYDNDLFARLTEILDFWGINNEDTQALLKDALKFGWDTNEFKMNLRKSKGYLANPLFAANVERAKAGKGWMDETQVIAWGTEAKRLAKQYGYNEPSNNYLAEGLMSGLSMAEIEHRFQIQDRVNTYGAGVRLAAQEMGFEIGDSDLFEIFDPEKDTKEWDDMFRRAQMRGRPLTLGLGIRSETEARAWEMMGLSPDEVFKRMEGVAANRSRFERLGSIEEQVRQGLPNDFGSHLMTAENGLLIRGLVFQEPEALAQLQNMTAREIARFKGGGGAASNQQGQLVGLLAPGER